MQLEASLGYNLDFVSKEEIEEVEDQPSHLFPKTKMLRDLNWIHFFLTPNLKQPHTTASRAHLEHSRTSPEGDVSLLPVACINTRRSYSQLCLWQ